MLRQRKISFGMMSDKEVCLSKRIWLQDGKIKHK